MLHNTVCKHAHLIEIYHNNIENTQPLESTYTDNPILEHPNNMQTDTPTYFTHILSKEKETELSSLKTKLKSIIAELQITIDQCTDVSTLQAMRTQLQSASSMSRAMKEHSSDIRLAVKRKIPPNRNQEKQLRVFSTKKKKLCATQALSKPSIAESNKQIDNLKKNDPKFCGVCLQENDCSQTDIIDWIQCFVCTLWIHTTCSETNTSSQNYVCHFCRTNYDHDST